MQWWLLGASLASDILRKEDAPVRPLPVTAVRDLFAEQFMSVHVSA